MIVYHGSTIEIRKPDLKHSRNKNTQRDFHCSLITVEKVEAISKFRSVQLNHIIMEYCGIN